MTTMRSLAEELGVSKQAITKKIDKYGWRDLLVRDGNQFLIDDNLKELIFQTFQSKAVTESDNQSPPPSTESVTLYTQVIDQMQGEIDRLQEQLQQKDKQIAALSLQLDKAQLVQERILQALPERTNDAADAPATEPRRRHWWQRRR